MIFRYPYSHLTVATAINLAAVFWAWLNLDGDLAALREMLPALLLVGPIFYWVRETIQRVQKGYWDIPGLLWPTAPWLVVAGLLTAF